jgi:ABC-type transporter Mla MlaB component
MFIAAAARALPPVDAYTQLRVMISGHLQQQPLMLTGDQSHNRVANVLQALFAWLLQKLVALHLLVIRLAGCCGIAVLLCLLIHCTMCGMRLCRPLPAAVELPPAAHGTAAGCQ